MNQEATNILFEACNGGNAEKKHFSDNFVLLVWGSISTTWTGGGVGGGVSVGSLLSMGIKQSRCNPCMQQITFPGTLRYLNCRFMALPSSFFLVLFYWSVNSREVSFAVFCIKYTTGRNEMQSYWRKMGILTLLPNMSENYR